MLIFRASSSSRPLLSIARKIAPTGPGIFGAGHNWIANDKFVYFLNDAITSTGRLVIVNAITGKSATVRTIDLKNLEILLDQTWFSWTIAPDMNTIVFPFDEAHRPDNPHPGLLVMHLAGKMSVEVIPLRSYGNAELWWSADGLKWRGYEDFPDGLYGIQRSARQPKNVTRIAGPLYGKKVVGCTPDNGVVLASLSKQRNGVFLDISIVHDVWPNRTEKQVKVKLPDGVQQWKMEISPDGRRIAYELEGATKSWIPNFLKRVPGLNRGDNDFDGIWTSNIDGTSFREIGRIDGQTQRHGYSCMRWTPDSKNISFDHDGFWWVVSSN